MYKFKTLPNNTTLIKCNNTEKQKVFENLILKSNIMLDKIREVAHGFIIYSEAITLKTF